MPTYPDDSSPELKHFRACNLCEAICGLEITVSQDKITSIRGDKKDPLSRGHICPKAVALQDIHNDPDRLRRPVRKTADGFEEISWEVAFDEVARRIREIRNQHGRGSLATYAGNPNVHNSGAILFSRVLTQAIAAQNKYSATSADQLPHQLVAHFLFGHQLLLPVPDIDRTQFMLIVGGNPIVSNGSLMTVPDVRKRFKDLRARGGQLVVVDPRRSETAEIADRYLPIRPGTDALFLAALVHVVLDEQLSSPGHLAELTDGIDCIREFVQDFTPEMVSETTGIPASDIRGLAHAFCAADSAVAYGRMGVSVQEFGALCQWLIQVLNIVTGNLDREGGAMFAQPAIDLLQFFSRGSYGRFRSRVRQLPEFGGELPVATMAEDMLADGQDRIRALFTIAGNPVLSAPNGRLLDQALGGLDFMVSIDFYINETTRHADIILPPTAALEHDHYDIVFHLLAIRNTTRYSQALFEPDSGAMHDWEIILALADRLTEGSLFSRLKAGAIRWWMKRKGPAGLIESMLRSGPHSDKVGIEELDNNPHGIDLGPLTPCLPDRLFTDDKKIHLAPDTITADLKRLRKSQFAHPGNGQLLLIGRRQARSNNSWMHNYHRLVKGKNRCTLLVNPGDAERLGLADGATATVRSRVGEVGAPVEICDSMMPGVVSLPHGWGHDRPGVRLETASRHPGVSINDLTDENRVDGLSGNAAFSAVPVVVTASGSNMP